jgi:hypothetical protein
MQNKPNLDVSLSMDQLNEVTGGAGLPVWRAGNPLPNSGTGPDVPKFVAGRQIFPKKIPMFQSGRLIGYTIY